MLSSLSGLCLQLPSIAKVSMPSEQPGLVMHLFAAMAVFLGIMLVLCSRDLPRRGALVAWEEVLRLIGCAFMVCFGLFSNAGVLAIISGIFDGAIGVAYLLLLPRHLGVNVLQLLLDRVGSPA